MCTNTFLLCRIYLGQIQGGIYLSPQEFSGGNSDERGPGIFQKYKGEKATRGYLDLKGVLKTLEETMCQSRPVCIQEYSKFPTY